MDLIKSTASQANNPDSLLGWGIPDVKSALLSLSVNEKYAEKEIHSYPNPVIDKLTVILPDAISGQYEIGIINIHGQVLYSKTESADSIRSIQIDELSNLKSGIYFLRVSQGQTHFTSKILKK
jgi:hypothetical protein